VNLTAQPKIAEIALHPTCVAVQADGMAFNEFCGNRVRPLDSGGVVAEQVRLELTPGYLATPGWRHFPRGLAYAILGKCYDAGFEVDARSYLPPSRLEPAWAEPGYETVIDFIRTRHFGTIDLSKGQVSVADMVAAASGAFPWARMVIITKNSPKPLLVELKRRHVPSVGSVEDVLGHPGQYRVVAATFGNLGKFDLDKADLVFPVDPFMTDRDDPRRVVLDLPEDVKKTCNRRGKLGDVRCPLFCIRTDSRELSPWEAAGHAEAFGMETIPLYSPLGKKYARRVEVITLASTARLVLPGGATAQKVKETAAMCPITVRRLAKMVRAIRNRDREAIEKLFGSDAPEEFFGAWNLPHLIYGGTLDAAEPLSKALNAADWPVLDGECSLPLNGFGVIATEAGIRRCSGPQFDLIIRADFGPGMPPFPQSWFTAAEPFAPPIYLIDFAVEAPNRMLRQWTRSRQEAYLAADWREWGQHPAIHEYRRFLSAVAPRRTSR
jgi:hypothetical protein